MCLYAVVWAVPACIRAQLTDQGNNSFNDSKNGKTFPRKITEGCHRTGFYILGNCKFLC
ncbi:hypothetical protein GDO81_029073 [Engystomops pustulosus]|uniref:Uncharacterized protein n=1 Tax=Engystomops pustulosus TaxID=76066 RepID=A0AAV6YJU7_ENGPU|nr:hypothetical protein GDO81_029073 [Engystomops pustulosus]